MHDRSLSAATLDEIVACLPAGRADMLVGPAAAAKPGQPALRYAALTRSFEVLEGPSLKTMIPPWTIKESSHAR